MLKRTRRIPQDAETDAIKNHRVRVHFFFYPRHVYLNTFTSSQRLPSICPFANQINHICEIISLILCQNSGVDCAGENAKTLPRCLPHIHKLAGLQGYSPALTSYFYSVQVAQWSMDNKTSTATYSCYIFAFPLDIFFGRGGRGSGRVQNIERVRHHCHQDSDSVYSSALWKNDLLAPGVSEWMDLVVLACASASTREFDQWATQRQLTWLWDATQDLLIGSGCKTHIRWTG